MSTNQLFLSKQKTKTFSEPAAAISSEQSQKLIQTMLTMSFGCLAFLRGLFPDEYFLDQRFIPEKHSKDFDKNKQANSIKIKTLIRGKSQEIDLLLDWLEKGVFQSIKLKYLRALSLGIFVEEDNPTDLCENYIFTFDYSGNNVSMSINSQDSTQNGVAIPPNEIIALKDSRKMVQQLMRRFIIITQSLEPLPDEKYLNMRLLFNENVEQDYQPTLFKDATFQPRATIKIPKSLDLDSLNVGQINTGYHGCNLSILSSCQNVNKNYDMSDNELLEDLQEIDPLQRIIDSYTPEKEKTKEDLLNSQQRLINNLNENIKTQVSQVANNLGNFLNSSQPSILATQIAPEKKIIVNNNDNKELLKCECNTGIGKNTVGELCCIKCGRLVHKQCYGNTKNSRIECFTCLYKDTNGGKLETTSKQFHGLMVLRKTYRVINKLWGNPPQSISEYMERVFSKEECMVEENINDFIFSLNCLFYDYTLQAAPENKTVSKYNIIFDILIDVLGIFSGDQKPFIMNEKYTLCFRLGNRSANSSYLKILPKSGEDIDYWLKDFERLEKNVNRHLYNSQEGLKNKECKMASIDTINLNSLAIQDTETQDPIQSGRKRNQLDLIQYLNTEESSLLPETYITNNFDNFEEESNTNKRKIRKISISKGTVKSSW